MSNDAKVRLPQAVAAGDKEDEPLEAAKHATAGGKTEI
jgi:hypothetical protein